MNEIAYILVGVGFVLAGISSILNRRVEHRLNGRVTAYYLFMVGIGLVWIVYAVALVRHDLAMVRPPNRRTLRP